MNNLVKAVKVTGSEIMTWNDRSDLNRSHEESDWAAIPAHLNPEEVRIIYTKCGGTHLWLKLGGDGINIRCFVDSNPEIAIREAVEDAEYDGKEPSDMAWWEDYR
jgi:hypothetical protein